MSHFVSRIVTRNDATRTYRQTRARGRDRADAGAILDAARALFRADPQLDPSLDAVAARAGVSTRTVIRQFGSKEGLLEAAIAAGVEAAPDDPPRRARRRRGRGARDRRPLRGDGRRSDALAGARRPAALRPPGHRTRHRVPPRMGRGGLRARPRRPRRAASAAPAAPPSRPPPTSTSGTCCAAAKGWGGRRRGRRCWRPGRSGARGERRPMKVLAYTSPARGHLTR